MNDTNITEIHLWTQQDAIPIIQSLEPLVSKYGYHVGLLGSVLTRGFSGKDLDILLYRHDHAQEEKNLNVLSESEILDKLCEVGIVQEHMRPSSARRAVFKCSLNGKPIDIFFI